LPGFEFLVKLGTGRLQDGLFPEERLGEAELGLDIFRLGWRDRKFGGKWRLNGVLLMDKVPIGLGFGKAAAGLEGCEIQPVIQVESVEEEITRGSVGGIDTLPLAGSFPVPDQDPFLHDFLDPLRALILIISLDLLRESEGLMPEDVPFGRFRMYVIIVLVEGEQGKVFLEEVGITLDAFT
jgi:hypothetical protein